MKEKIIDVTVYSEEAIRAAVRKNNNGIKRPVINRKNFNKWLVISMAGALAASMTLASIGISEYFKAEDHEFSKNNISSVDSVPLVDPRIFDIEATADIKAEELDNLEKDLVARWDMYIEKALSEKYSEDFKVDLELLDNLEEKYKAITLEMKTKAIMADRFTTNHTNREFTMADTYEGQQLIAMYEPILFDCSLVLGETFAEFNQAYQEELEQNAAEFIMGSKM